MTLILYYFNECPYCMRVVEFIERHAIKTIELRNIRTSENHLQELLKINQGNRQVPCLVIDGVPMLESEDIIHYLQNHIFDSGSHKD